MIKYFFLSKAQIIHMGMTQCNRGTGYRGRIGNTRRRELGLIIPASSFSRWQPAREMPAGTLLVVHWVRLCPSSAGPQDWKRSVFIPIPKKGNTEECSNDRITALISHGKESNAQNSPSQYVNHELPDVEASFIKGRRTRHQIANIRWTIK